LALELDFFLEICGGFLLTGGHDVSPHIWVNSYHHQAINRLSPKFQATAISEDGLIEGIYMPAHKFILGVQWHPEFSYETDDNSKKLIRTFVTSISTTS
jgi:gamma-glutamyl-gamma-aminobutyrate hydrolase PuuD